MLRILFLISFILLLSGALHAQAPIKLNKLEQPIVFDGMPDENAWDTIESLPVVQYEPVFQGEMSEVTRIKIAYDQKYIYLAGEMLLEDPANIRSNSLYRDRYSSDDVLAIVIDGFNDDQNATWFSINPDGVRVDRAISNDMDFSAGGNVLNSSYNTFWDAITKKTEKGWFAEIRIPFSSIGIQVEEDIADIGFIVYRWLAYNNERHVYPVISPNFRMGIAKPSQAQDATLEGVQSSNPVYITPYGLSGLNRSSGLNSDSSDYVYSGDPTIELGADIKYNITSNLTLDVTLNTDFAQVEVDDQQLNLSRFNLFFPEKRLFFQQRAGLFDFNYGDDRVFYSRRIGLDQSGNQVRILGGARLTGRIGNWDVGFLNLQTGQNDNIPTENFGVLRLRRQALNTRSFVGGIITSRISDNGSNNYILGGDTYLNLAGENFLEFRYSRMFDQELSSAQQSDWARTSAIRFGLRNTQTTGLNYQFLYNRTGDLYVPEMGFIRINDVTENRVGIGYGILSPEESVFQRQSFSLSLFSRNFNDGYRFLNYGDALQTKNAQLRWEGNFKQLGELSISFTRGEEAIRTQDTFNLVSRIFVPEGRYVTNRTNISYRFNEAWKLGGRVGLEFGEIYDGNIYGFNVSPRLFLSRKLELGGSYRFTHLEFPNDLQRFSNDFSTHLGQFRGQYAFNRKASINLFLQFSNVSDQIGTNLRFRYMFREGQDLWLVINEQYYADREALSPNLPRLPSLQSRSILLKYTHTFIK
ncbi:DUF5916 domain-containing protein [Balneola sp. MJW-20]|uniref:DUF5916 domain-containing protein n=1 Tax=Gracilimonas aurantiaca TaxID=3234185 RepID=UPI003467DB61